MTNLKIRFFGNYTLFFVFSFFQLNCSQKQSVGGDVSSNNENIIEFEHRIIDENGPVDIWGKAYGDVNGNGKPDLLAGGFRDGGLVWYENPSWEKHVISGDKGFSTDLEVYDIDRDGDLDIFSVMEPGQNRESGTLVWFENPNWEKHIIETSTSFHDIELADLNGDGLVDIVARDQGAFGSSADTLYIYLQKERLKWEKHKINCPNGEGLKVGDINGNGRPDVVVNQVWFENSGDGINWKQHTYAPRYFHQDTFIDIADINGNGRMDIVLSPAELAGEYYRISWFEAPEDPTQRWKEHVIEPWTETVHHFVGLADMNNNGETDIVTARMMQGEDPDEVSIYRNLGKGENWEKQVIYTGGSHSMRLVDLDGDGDIDMYGANWRNDNRVHLWINQSKAP
ncbi:FG-GAP repeat domain-containing protein [Negadavirga shengliensis]|uniref:FG-GAP repeat domain-containing protein n=1 Tax=Negadavirga shengliensis TaxID=1389218 RepID=A0ABV9T412_9BACT